MLQFVHLGVSVSLEYTFNNLPIISRLIGYKELDYVLENKKGEILSIDGFKESVEKMTLNKEDIPKIQTIHFIYKIFSIMAEHTGSIFNNSTITIDKNISKLKHGRQIFKAVGIEKDKISVGYTFSSYV